MATVQYIAQVRDGRTLELPEEAQELGLQSGDQITVTVERDGIRSANSVSPNLRGLAAMNEISERQKERPYTEGSNIVKLVREARTGAMYGHGPTE